MKSPDTRLSLVVALVCLPSLSYAADLQQQRLGTTGPKVKTQSSLATGNTTFLSVVGRNALISARTIPVDSEQASIEFLQQYGDWFGLGDTKKELRKISRKRKSKSKSRVKHAVKFQQHRNGIDIFGAQVIVRLDDNFDVVGVSSGASSGTTKSLSFKLDKNEAADSSLSLVSKLRPDVDAKNLGTKFKRKIIFNPALVDAGMDQELAAYEFHVSDIASRVSHMVYINANTGAVLLHYSKIHDIKNRIIVDQFNDYTLPYPNTVTARSEGGPPTAVSDVNNAYDYAGDTYDFYFNEHGRDSLDDAGMDLLNVVRYCPNSPSCPYGNAFWNGSYMTYGDGYASDDVVGHELAHGVTEFTSNLIYANQSGAINESLSDLWGEFIDLSNTSGNDSAAVRWKMGEDLPIGAIRDMGDPPVHNHPDKISSTNYYCGTGDYGGVHINSGVNNKAVSLMVDGGVFNGQAITGIGISKTADVYYQAQTNYLTSSSGWQDLYHSLQSSCSDLIGVDGMTADDCTQVGNALDAVEMSQGNACVSGPPPELCPAGEVPTYSLNDGFESGTLGNWTETNILGSNSWDVVNNIPHSGTQHVQAGNPGSTSSSALQTAQILPPYSKLAFDHIPNMENYWDGGVVEYSTDGNTTWSDLLTDSPSVEGFGYNLTLVNSSTNPLEGRPAFSGTNTYKRTIVDLSSVAGNTSLRFHLGTDSSVSAPGWSIDNVTLFTCGVPADLYCDGKAVTVNIGAGQTPTSGDDVIWGTNADDHINGLGGNDTICGRDGADEIYGGPGDDTLFGNGAIDQLFGGSGDDHIFGGLGGDSIYGQGGEDTVNGDGGYDYIYGGSGNDTLTAGAGGAYVNGGGNSDTLIGSSVADALYGTSGLDTINGNGGDDNLYGGNGADVINGGAGDDHIYGQGHADTLTGGPGNDTIFGGSGNDSMNGGNGIDTCSGQGGNNSATACESTSVIPPELRQPSTELQGSPAGNKTRLKKRVAEKSMSLFFR